MPLLAGTRIDVEETLGELLADGWQVQIIPDAGLTTVRLVRTVEAADVDLPAALAAARTLVDR